MDEERVEMREKGGYRPKIHPNEVSNQVLPSRSETEEHLRSKYGNFSLAPNRQLATRGGACYRQPVPNFFVPISADCEDLGTSSSIFVQQFCIV